MRFDSIRLTATAKFSGLHATTTTEGSLCMEEGTNQTRSVVISSFFCSFSWMIQTTKREEVKEDNKKARKTFEINFFRFDVLPIAIASM